MSYETVTVTCSEHRRRCALAETPRGGGIRIRHEGPGDTGLCGSEQFTVLRVQEASRGSAHAELIRLDMMAQAQAALDGGKGQRDG